MTGAWEVGFVPWLIWKALKGKAVYIVGVTSGDDPNLAA